MTKQIDNHEMLDMILQEANPFAVLGLNFKANENDIKRAYHQLKRLVHPDCFLETETKEKAQRAFIRLGKIFEELIDSHLRSQWRNKLSQIQSFNLSPLAEAQGQSASDWAYSFFQTGQEFVLKNQWEQAISAFQKAIRISPHIPDFHCFLAMSLHSKGKLREAQNSLYTALRLDPYHPLSMHYLERIQVDFQVKQLNAEKQKRNSEQIECAFLLIQKAISCQA